jgi:cytochrome c553
VRLATGLLILTLASCAFGAEAAPKASAAPSPPDFRQHEYDTLARDLANRAWFAKVAGQAFRTEALILDADRDPLDVVLRRTAALLDDLSARPGCRDLSGLRGALAALAEAAARTPVADAPARRDLFFGVCGVRRQAALANPLLDFTDILVVARPRAGFDHMCDQYYGCFAEPTDGGLYVLEGVFGPRLRRRNVLEGAVVQAGRLKGRRLDHGGFLSPDLSWDGRNVLFAYTEAGQGDPWSPQRCFHVFRVGLDGAGLTQLTDGPVNDFDPVWLPGGRIAFMSERRGGFCRCGGRPVPTYTLHGMNPDGSGVAALSWHETNEWHPSVTHDGLIVYSRWDYVDRDTNVAHHPWLTAPDGRDARAVQGNYPATRNARPWMELNVRAIPGSRRFVATAAPHHGQAYGSLVVIDPDVPDDGAMSPVRRLTPEEPFPEGECRGDGPYATAWPLDETHYLAAYRGAVCLLDAFGNRTVLADAGGPYLDPIPVRSRSRPPVVPDRNALFARADGPSAADPAAPDDTATLAVMNVYDSLKGWPEGTRIAALRVIQLLPKSTPLNNRPRIGVADQANARAILGTVPVEADGSAHFRVPAGKPVYFQALDERGMAVQSMRSVTYLHPGETVACQGCHEPKHRGPAAARPAPLALGREASALAPGPDGSNPLNFVRLVQPVIERNCVDCHRREPKAPRLDRPPDKNGWTGPYQALAAKYGFFYNVSNGSFPQKEHGGARSEPGAFGARASPLMAIMLGPEHGRRGLRLSDDDLRRLALWLDANSDFYGAYEETQAQARGEAVAPSLE